MNEYQRAGMGLWVLGSYNYKFIFIFCRAGGYPPDQNFKIRYLSVSRIFKISITVSVHIYTSGQADGRASGSAGLVKRVRFHGFLPTLFSISILKRLSSLCSKYQIEIFDWCKATQSLSAVFFFFFFWGFSFWDMSLLLFQQNKAKDKNCSSSIITIEPIKLHRREGRP